VAPTAPLLVVGEHYKTGDEVEVEVRLFDKEGKPRPMGKALAMRIEPPEGKPLDVELRAQPGTAGQRGWFAGRFRVERRGFHGVGVERLPARFQAPPGPPQALSQQLTAAQQELARQYKEWSVALLEAIKRLGADKTPGARAKADAYRRALALAQEKGIAVRFEKLAMLLSGKLNTVARVKDAVQPAQELAKDL